MHLSGFAEVSKIVEGPIRTGRMHKGLAVRNILQKLTNALSGTEFESGSSEHHTNILLARVWLSLPTVVWIKIYECI